MYKELCEAENISVDRKKYQEVKNSFISENLLLEMHVLFHKFGELEFHRAS